MSQQKATNSKEVKILGKKIDRKLLFHQHIKSISKKADQKLKPHSLKIKKESYLIKSQFNYCSLVWIFCSRKSNSLGNKVQETALRLTYKDNENNLQTLLNENNETSIHHRNLHFLMT